MSILPESINIIYIIIENILVTNDIELHISVRNSNINQSFLKIHLKYQNSYFFYFKTLKIFGLTLHEEKYILEFRKRKRKKKVMKRIILRIEMM